MRGYERRIKLIVGILYNCNNATNQSFNLSFACFTARAKGSEVRCNTRYRMGSVVNTAVRNLLLNCIKGDSA